jgi:hypothetical protein
VSAGATRVCWHLRPWLPVVLVRGRLVAGFDEAIAGARVGRYGVCERGVADAVPEPLIELVAVGAGFAVTVGLSQGRSRVSCFDLVHVVAASSRDGMEGTKHAVHSCPAVRD